MNTCPHGVTLRRGKWAAASKEDVEAEMAKGTPYCYRFRVPKNQVITIKVRRQGCVCVCEREREERLVYRGAGLYGWVGGVCVGGGGG